MSATTPRSAPRGLLKRFFVGRALATHKQEHQLLPKFLALPVFSSDPLSSNAYATEEMMLVLVAAGAGAFRYMIPIGIAIAALLVIVVTSYRQTVRAYPRGGGSYIVSKENLGTFPGLVAAAAILTDYVLTVAVSVTAGTVAVISAAPDLARWRVEIALGFVALVTLANLRGVREAGTVFAIPTYGFVATVATTLLVGAVRCLAGCPVAESATLPVEATHALTLFLILRAFSSGATALTGVEAIADGVQAFRRPQSRNAAATLALMGAMSITMFLGITVLAHGFGVRVSEDLHQRSVLAQIGHTAFGGGPAFIVLQVFTAGILVLAANTAYQDFPRLSAILARDRFMPSQFRNRGDRLVFSNGILVLAGLAGLLIWTFDANLNRLIQLYVVGVFTAFTLSQAGMVRRWFRTREEGWRRSAAINAIGATTTGVVLVIVTLTKFSHGAWIVITAMPIIVAFFLAVHHYYLRVGRALRVRLVSADERPSNTFLVLVADLGPELLDAVRYLRGVRAEDVVPLYIGPAERYEEMALEWTTKAPRLGKLELLVGGDDRPARAVKRYIRAMDREPADFVTVVIPEALTGRSWLQFVRRRAGLFLKSGLLFEPGVVVTDVPLLPEERGQAVSYSEHPTEMVRHVVLVPISGVHDASVRAVIYGRALQPALTQGIVFVSEPEEAAGLIDAWHDRGLDVPLVFVEAPFRDLGTPLLNEIRKHTDRGDTWVTVVLPELIPRHWWENLLHNQTAFYIKRLLLFEPDVVVTSVPFHLRTAPIEVPEGAAAGAGPVRS
jgi:amino acid transporter